MISVPSASSRFSRSKCSAQTRFLFVRHRGREVLAGAWMK
jgi:hypothetical protein